MTTLDCLVTGRGVDEAERTANTDFINAALTAGGEVHFPVDALVEVNSNLEISADVRIYLHGARLIARGDIATQRLFNVANTGLAVGLRDGVLEGFTEDEVMAAGPTGSYGIYGRADMTLALQNVSFDEWFGNALQGSSGVSVHIDGGRWQAWKSHIAGGDGAREYVVRDATFGRVGSGKGTDHQMYINPDVWLYLDNCDFEPLTGWNVHYYGSDSNPPYRTPVFSNCLFRGKVFTSEICHTLVDSCDFVAAVLQVQNNALISNCRFIGDGTKEGRAMLGYRTGGARYVRVTDVEAENALFLCEADHLLGTIYRFENLHLISSDIENRARELNHIEVHGGLWESGELDVGNGTAHLGGRLFMGATKYIHGGVLTESDVI